MSIAAALFSPLRVFSCGFFLFIDLVVIQVVVFVNIVEYYSVTDWLNWPEVVCDLPM